MDFKKIELIFLGVFVSINIFLFFTIWQAPYLSQNKTTNSQTNIRTEMKADNITAKNISSKTDEGYYLASKVNNNLATEIASLQDQRTSYDQTTHVLSSRLNIVLKGAQYSDILTAVKKFKDNDHHILHGAEYVYSSQLSSEHDMIFVQKTKFGNIVDENGQLHFYVRDGQVTNYTQSYQANVTVVREKQETISPEQAVNNLYMYSELPNDSRVVSVKLGYTQLTEVKGSKILTPTWTAMIENKNTKNLQMKKVNAFNGSIITDSLDKIDETN